MNNSVLKERSYTPHSYAGWGWRVWRDMVEELIASRELIWRLLVRDFAARYRQSVLGAMWAVISPLIAVGTFVFLNSSGLLNVGDTGIPYTVYALLGLTVWHVFAGGVTATSNSVVSGGALVLKINFPKETLVLAALGQMLFELLVRLLLLLVLLLVFSVTPKWTIVFLPLVLIPLLLFTVGLGFLLALANAVIRDVGQAVAFVTTFLMFLTPVIYPAPQGSLFAAVSRYNPLAALVTGAKDMVILGHFSDPFGFAWTSALAAVLLLFGWRVFHLAEPRMVERV